VFVLENVIAESADAFVVVGGDEEVQVNIVPVLCVYKNIDVLVVIDVGGIFVVEHRLLDLQLFGAGQFLHHLGPPHHLGCEWDVHHVAVVDVVLHPLAAHFEVVLLGVEHSGGALVLLLADAVESLVDVGLLE